MSGAKQTKGILEKIDEFPPFLIYALFRKRRKRTTREKILKELYGRFKFSPRTFERLAAKVSWRGVRVELIDAFCHACEFDWSKKSFHRAYIRKVGRRYGAENCFWYLSERRKRTFRLRCQQWREIKAKACSPP